MSRTRVKICGITSPEDARAAVAAGADAIGVIVYPKSPRHVQRDMLPEIRAVVPAFVALTLVSVDLPVVELSDWIHLAKPDLLQFHGKESADHIATLNMPYIKSIRMRDDADLKRAEQCYAGARALLLDTFVPGVVGGTGETFSWHRAREVTRLPVVLAGGLNPACIGEAIAQAQPYAVDVSSSLESEPGRKDHAVLLQFMQAVRDADNRRGVG